MDAIKICPVPPPLPPKEFSVDILEQVLSLEAATLLQVLAQHCLTLISLYSLSPLLIWSSGTSLDSPHDTQSHLLVL